MPDFTLTANSTSISVNDLLTLTITADSSFKDTVNLSGSTLNGATFVMTPTSVFLCPDQQKTASVIVTAMSTDTDELTLSAVAPSQSVSHDVVVDVYN